MSAINPVQQAEARLAIVQTEETIRGLDARISQLSTTLNRIDYLVESMNKTDNGGDNTKKYKEVIFLCQGVPQGLSGSAYQREVVPKRNQLIQEIGVAQSAKRIELAKLDVFKARAGR